MPMPASLTVLWVHLFTPLMPSILLEQEALELLELLCILSNLMIKSVSLKTMFLRTVSACRYDQVSYHDRSQTWLSLFILFSFCVLGHVSFLVVSPYECFARSSSRHFCKLGSTRPKYSARPSAFHLLYAYRSLIGGYDLLRTSFLRVAGMSCNVGMML